MKKNFDKNNENCLEFLTRQRTMTVTFCSRSWINKIKKYAKSHPDAVTILKINVDGSICAQIPTAWLKISPPRKTNLTEDQRRELSERFRRNCLPKTQ